MVEIKFFRASCVFAIVGLFAVNVNAGPLAVVVLEKAIETASDVAVSTTNKLTGGVTSQSGNVSAHGLVDGSVTSAAIGKNSKTYTTVGSSRGVNAQGDISTNGSIGGGLTNAAIGSGAVSVKTIGSSGN